MRYFVSEVLVNPVTMDTFGLSDKDMTYFFLLSIVSTFVGIVLL